MWPALNLQLSALSKDPQQRTEGPSNGCCQRVETVIDRVLGLEEPREPTRSCECSWGDDDEEDEHEDEDDDDDAAGDDEGDGDGGVVVLAVLAVLGGAGGARGTGGAGSDGDKV